MRPPALRQVSVIPLVPAWRLDHSFDYSVPDKIADTIEVGSVVRVRLGHRNVRGVVVGGGDGPAPSGLEPVLAVIVTPAPARPPLTDLLEWMARRYVAPRGAAFARVVPPRVRVTVRPPESLTPVAAAPHLLPTYRAGGQLLAALGAGGAGAWCLQSAWAEDRGALIAEMVAAASPRAALVAAPEVRHGSLLLEELARRWPELERVDSSRSEGERSKAWLRLAAGHGGGAGGRAAVLAPAPGLGLIVVDDEHNPSYKEDRAPRFDPRRVALKRAQLQGAVCVLVSAAPSLEWYGPSSLRSVEPAPLRRRAMRPVIELLEPASERAFSHAFHERVAAALERGEKVGLLASRRGYARTLWCASCRASLRCPVCEAGLAYDRASSRVRCPRCDYQAPVPSRCPRCSATELRALGAGSERLAEQLARSFPRAAVGRIDPDVLESSAGRGVLEPCDIYVSTWVGTKPELRPEVSVVGVLDVDGLVRRPDFRAAENAYQALVAMAEWAGPASTGGRLLIETSEPAHHAVQALMRADHGFFVERELAQRAELRYPPYSELVVVKASGPEASTLAQGAAAACREAGAEVLGPIVRRLRGEPPEQQLLAKCLQGADPVAEALRPLVSGAPRTSRLWVDVDPR